MTASSYFAILRHDRQKLHCINPAKLEMAAKRVHTTQHAVKKIIVIGNCGSTAMASDVTVDFTKTAGIRAVNFNKADLLICFANDYAYENWVTMALEFYAYLGDLLVLASSNGKSPNMPMAYCKPRAWG